MIWISPSTLRNVSKGVAKLEWCLIFPLAWLLEWIIENVVKSSLENMDRSFKRLVFMVMGKFQGFKKNSMEQYQEKFKNPKPLISVLLIAI